MNLTEVVKAIEELQDMDFHESLKKTISINALTSCLVALEKQVPKRVKGITSTYEGIEVDEIGNCPCCNKFVSSKSDKPNICVYGQMLMWGKDYE